MVSPGSHPDASKRASGAGSPSALAATRASADTASRHAVQLAMWAIAWARSCSASVPATQASNTSLSGHPVMAASYTPPPRVVVSAPPRYDAGVTVADACSAAALAWPDLPAPDAAFAELVREQVVDAADVSKLHVADLFLAH